MKGLNEIREAAQHYIYTHYEATQKPYEYRAYHGPRHSLWVERATGMLGAEVRKVAPDLFTERDLRNSLVAAAVHDVRQEWFWDLNPKGLRIRKRVSPNIETASANFGIGLMAELPEFTYQDALDVEAYVSGTEPLWDPEKMRLTQPKVKPGAKIGTVLLGMADLSGSFIGGGQGEHEPADRQVFQEDELWVLESILDLKRLQEPPNAAQIAQEMVGKMKFKVDFFLKGLLKRLEEEYAPALPNDDIRQVILLLCDKGPQAEQAALAVVDKTERLAGAGNFWGLIDYFGYRLPA